MYFIAGFGMLLMLLSVVMIASPQYWSDGIVSFSNKSYFHWCEVISRIVAGFIFITFHQATLYPNLILSMGCLFTAVGFGLLVFGSAWHRKFAVWSASRFKSIFRLAGLGALIFGIFLVHVSNIGLIDLSVMP